MQNNINKFEEKFISVLIIFFLTFWVTFFVTAWKLWFTGAFIKDWMLVWAIVLLWIMTLMCFVVSPIILNWFKLKWKLRQMVWLLILTLIFAFIFSYRFDAAMLGIFNWDYIKTILINWWVVVVIAFPFAKLVAWPLAKKLSWPLAK